MKHIKKQRGFIDLDDLVGVFYLALVGIIALLGFAVYVVYSAIKYFI